VPAAIVALSLAFLLSACEEDRAVVSPAASSGNRYAGKALLNSYGCAACHRIRGLREHEGQSGPPLERIAFRNYLAGVLPNTPDNLVRWIRQPRVVSPGTAMPDLGVNAAEARDMAAYLYQQELP
jgi:cytochrome c2